MERRRNRERVVVRTAARLHVEPRHGLLVVVDRTATAPPTNASHNTAGSVQERCARALVTDKEHERVLPQAPLLERADEPADVGVERRHEAIVQAAI